MNFRLLMLILSLLSLTPRWSLAAKAKKSKELEAFVSTEKAFVWSQPGYSWMDCRPLEPDEPENKFKSKQDEELTMQRFKSGGKDVCNARDKKEDLLSAGDSVDINTDKDGKPLYKEFPIMIGGELMKKKFYLVTSARGRVGWMSEDQVTEPAPKEYARPQAAGSNRYCPPGSKTANQLKGLALTIPEIQNATDKHMALASPKSDRDVDHFACLYHDDRIDDDEFPSMYKKFQKSAKQASKAFGVPYSLIMCTMLVESGLYYNPKETKEYKGLPQFGSALVEDLGKVSKRPPYVQMMSKYAQANPGVALTDHAVRSSPDPTAPVAAIALAYQWIYWDRIKQSGCRDCSMSAQLSRKELYMLVTGYNWGPYSLNKVSGKSAFDMRTSPPPPKESRDYMVRMENCMESGHDRSFREEAETIIKPKKPKNSGHLKTQVTKVVRKARRQPASERELYKERVEECDRTYPVK